MSRRQARDFFAYLAPYLTDEERSRFRRYSGLRITQALGRDLCDQLGARLRDDRRFRGELLADMRRAAWWLRNARWNGRVELRPEAALFYEGLALLAHAGADVDDVLAFAHCTLTGCICSGCDLASGARFDSLPGQWRRLLEEATSLQAGVDVKRGTA